MCDKSAGVFVEMGLHNTLPAPEAVCHTTALHLLWLLGQSGRTGYLEMANNPLLKWLHVPQIFKTSKLAYMPWHCPVTPHDVAHPSSFRM